MDIEKTNQQLNVCLIRDFNLLAARKIKKLANDVETIRIDLKNSRFVDSEAIKLLYEWVKQGKKVRLIKPPEIFFEVISVLGLDKIFSLDEMLER